MCSHFCAVPLLSAFMPCVKSMRTNCAREFIVVGATVVTLLLDSVSRERFGCFNDHGLVCVQQEHESPAISNASRLELECLVCYKYKIVSLVDLQVRPQQNNSKC